MRFLLLCLLAVLLLSACDSTDTTAPLEDPLIGTWSDVASSYRLFATSTITQEVIDYTTPGTSTLRVEGETSGLLRYPHFEGSNLLGLVSAPQIDLTPPLPHFRLLVDPFVETFGGEVLVTTASGATKYLYVSSSGKTPFTVNLPEVTYHDAVFRHLGDSLRVNGTLTFASRTLEAGLEGLLAEWAWEQQGTIPQYTLDADGEAYRIDIDTTHVGTWERVSDDTLRLVFETSSGEVDTFTYTYQLVDGVLLLTALSDVCTSDAASCMATYETRFHVAANTLVHVRVETTGRLEQDTGSAAP
ncbi:MAG: hypothetical protein HKN04_13975 [Rhodothermaceae bacterium]|nr:hypothetical protein [Rhodothermaceae bacterium]